MNDLPVTAISAPEGSRYPSPVEQKLFEISPVGTLPTAMAIFVVLFASFEACAWITHYPLADQMSFSPQEGAWPAAILSLLVAVVLAMQRYVRLKGIEDERILAHLLPWDVPQIWTDDPARRQKLVWAGIGGALVGLAFSIVVVPAHVRSEHIVALLWFAAVMSLLGAMTSRGAVMTRMAARDFADRVDRTLTVDLLRIDELSVIGRASARVALIWLSVAAIICLFFVGGHVPALVIGTIVFSAGMALWIFFGSLERVHRKIRATKLAELDRIRREIAAVRAESVRDERAAARLHGLIAYEGRIAAAHEWPFDQSTLLRIGVYVLIPAIPSLGRLALGFVMERIAQ
jgi:hypothetical protein